MAKKHKPKEDHCEVVAAAYTPSLIEHPANRILVVDHPARIGSRPPAPERVVCCSRTSATARVVSGSPASRKSSACSLQGGSAHASHDWRAELEGRRPGCLATVARI